MRIILGIFRILLILLSIIVLAACGGPAPTPRPVAVLPSRVPPTAGPTPTLLPTATLTPTATPTSTETPVPTSTSTPTETPVPSARSEQFVIQLTWGTADDLDLSVRDPRGAILSAADPQASEGARFSGDANPSCQNVMAAPIELATWPAGTAAAGQYAVTALHAGSCGDGSPVDATVTIRLGSLTLLEQHESLKPGWELLLNFDFDLMNVTGVEVVEHRLPVGPQPVRYGETVADSISDEQFEYRYFFDGQVNDVISISMQRTSGNLDAALRLLDPGGRELAANNDVGTGDTPTDALIDSYSLPATGTFTIVATRALAEIGPSTGGFSLALNMLVRGTALPDVTGGVLSYGMSSRGPISDQRVSVPYGFLGRAGEVVSVEMRRLSGNLDPYLTLSSGQGVVLALNDDAGAEDAPQDARIDHFLLPAAGVYTITAGRSPIGGGSGVYEMMLTLEGTDPASASEASRVLQLGDTVTGEITAEQAERRYPFFGRQNTEVVITLAQRSGNLNTYLALLDAAGNRLAFNDDAPGSQTPGDSRIEGIRLPATGVYTIVASRSQSGDSTGEFALTVDQLQSPTAVPGPTATPVPRALSFGDVVRGMIDNQTPRVDFTFEGEQGQVITITLSRLDANTDLDTLLILLDAAGNRLAVNDDAPQPDNPDSTDARISGFRLPETGLYTIVATRFALEAGTSSGPFELSLSRDGG